MKEINFSYKEKEKINLDGFKIEFLNSTYSNYNIEVIKSNQKEMYVLRKNLN